MTTLSTARIRALEKGADRSLTTCIVAAILAVPAWFWFAFQLEPRLSDDGTSLVGGLTTGTALAGAFALAVTLLCAVSWGAHVVLSTMFDAEVADRSQ